MMKTCDNFFYPLSWAFRTVGNCLTFKNSSFWKTAKTKEITCKIHSIVVLTCSVVFLKMLENFISTNFWDSKKPLKLTEIEIKFQVFHLVPQKAFLPLSVQVPFINKLKEPHILWLVRQSFVFKIKLKLAHFKWTFSLYCSTLWKGIFNEDVCSKEEKERERKASHSSECSWKQIKRIKEKAKQHSYMINWILLYKSAELKFNKIHKSQLVCLVLTTPRDFSSNLLRMRIITEGSCRIKWVSTCHL